MWRILALLLVTTIIGRGALAGSIESYVSFQARLTDDQGMPLSGLHTLDFFIYAEPTGGTPIGAVLNVNVDIAEGSGVVSTPIGPIAPSWFEDAPRYLAVTIDDEDDDPIGDELAPRTWLLPVPVAMWAENVSQSAELSVATGYVTGNFKVDGNTGFGLVNPEYRVQVLGPLLPPSGFLGQGRGAMAISSGSIAGLDFTRTWGGGLDMPAARIAADVSEGRVGSSLIFGTSSDMSMGVTNTAMVIGPDGRVGLNNPNPTNGSMVITAPFADENWGLTFSQLVGQSARIYLMPDGHGDFNWVLGRGGDDGLVMGPEGRIGVGGAPRNEPGHFVDFVGPAGGTGFTFEGSNGTRYVVQTEPSGSLTLDGLSGTGSNFRVTDMATSYFGPADGQATPGHAVTVNGTMSTKTLVITGGNDLAESMRTRGSGDGVRHVEPAPGMVVVADMGHPGDVKVATVAYDQRTIGVISGANGLPVGAVLDMEGDGLGEDERPIALAGRVWCWCDASHGAIGVGDMLTSSPTPGHAMKAIDRERAFGAVIGKAMTDLREGRGLVLVFVGGC